MAIPAVLSPLETPLSILAAEDVAPHDTLSALKRIKHILIGNTNRKLEFCSSRDGIEYILRQLSNLKSTMEGNDEIEGAVSCESLAILASLAIAREGSLRVLLDLAMYQHLFECLRRCATLLSEMAHDASPADDEDRICAFLIHTIRTLRALYVAFVHYVDPIGADLKTYELVVRSAYNDNNRGLVFSSGNTAPGSRSEVKSNNPRWQSSNPVSPPAAAKKALPKTAAGHARAKQRQTFREEAGEFVEHMCLDEQARTLIYVLDTASSLLDTVSAHNRSVMYEVIRNACDIIASCTRTATQRDAAFSSPAASHRSPSSLPEEPTKLDPTVILFGLLQSAPSQVAQSAISAIAALIKDEASPGNRHLTLVRSTETGGPWSHISSKATAKSSSMRLAAAECQVNLYKNLQRLGQGWDRELAGAPIVATLLQLLSDRSPPISARAAFALAYFVTDDRGLQETATNMDAFVRLKDLLERLDEPILPYETDDAAAERSRQQQAALLAIAALCMDIEEQRRRMLDVKLLPHIIAGSSSPFSNVRCAAAQCTRALSRSISLLKCAFVDTGAGPALFSLLESKETLLTQLSATAVMSNVFTEFSPLKGTLLSIEGLVERIVEFSKISRESQPADNIRGPTSDSWQDKMVFVKGLLRHHALSTIKNMTYWSSSALKVKTMTCLTWEYTVALLRDPNPAVQSETIGILRNIACNDAADIDLVIRGVGEARLFHIIEEALYQTRYDMLLNALYLIVNMATGKESHRACIMNRQGVLRAIHAHLSHPASEIRVAAVWAIVNLCHQPEGSTRRYNDTAARLRSLGIESKLKDLRDDPSIDVRERVRDALEGSFDYTEMPGSMALD